MNQKRTARYVETLSTYRAVLQLMYENRTLIRKCILFEKTQIACKNKSASTSIYEKLMQTICHLQLLHKLRLQLHSAKAIDFTINIMIAINQTDTFHFCTCFYDI